jgi:hypothetical protein
MIRTGAALVAVVVVEVVATVKVAVEVRGGR